MTHLPISPILNAAVQMTSSRNSGCPDDSSTDFDIEVRSKKLLFNKGYPSTGIED